MAAHASEAETDHWYRLLVAAIPVFIFVYAVIADLPPLLHKGGPEKYLFYHWLVFTQVPSRVETTYEAEVVSVQRKPVPPTRIESMGVLLSDELRQPPEYNRRIHIIGSLIDSGSIEQANKERLDLEQFVIKKPLRYQVVEIRYNPIMRFRTGEIISRRVIGTYEVHAP